jgi:hypothetical protein
LNEILETALLHGRVETGARSTSFEMESPEKQLAGKRLSEDEKREERIRLTAIRLAERAGKDYEQLVGRERGEFQVLAERQLTARASK